MVHEEHLSYADIGQRYGVDPSAVGYWLKKHGIPQPTIWGTRHKGDAPVLPTRDELEAQMADGASVRAVARRYGVSTTPIRDLCKRHGIKVQPGGWQGGIRHAGADGHEVRSTYELHVCDWLHARGIEHEYEPRVPFDRRFRADFLANGWYIEVWGVFGSRRYTDRKKRKRDLYKSHDLPLVEISYADFSTARRHRLEARLTTCLFPPPTRIPGALPL